MTGHSWTVSIGVVALAVVVAGCHSAPAPRGIVAAEPPLTGIAEAPGAMVVEVPPPRAVTFVDRHPLFSKPREYYEISGNNKLVKAGAATVVGIPAGIVGEIRQIVVGRPPTVTAY